MKRFFLTIMLPALLAITLFVGVLYLVIVPGFEKAILDRKKEMLTELTNSAWSLIREYDDEYEAGLITLEEAKSIAAEKIGRMRYGEEGKDYFWITDMQPKMIMHPYRLELQGSDLSSYKDPAGNHLFVEARDVVKSDGEGFVDYIWQWKDDSLRIVPKLSFVKGYPRWGWVVGTGIYLEDVAAEIKSLERNLLRIISAISVVVLLILFYIVRQSLIIERRRKSAETSLRYSRRKYKALVEASADGTVMFVDGKMIFANQRFKQMTGDPSANLSGMGRRDLFEADWDDIEKRLTGSDRSVNTEAVLKGAGTVRREVLLNISRVVQDNKPGYIIIARDAGTRPAPPIDLLGLSEEVQASLLLMGQPVKPLSTPPVWIDVNKSVEEAAQVMRSRNSSSLLVRSGEVTVGIITAIDIIERVVAGGGALTTLVGRVMTSPLLSLTEESTIFEAIYYMQRNRITITGITDAMGEISGMINIGDLREAQDSSLTFAARKAGMAQTVSELKAIYSTVPLIVTAFMDGGGNIRSLLKVITSITDAITVRVIELAMKEMGASPAPFVFIALGSEGRGEQTLFTDQDNAIIYSNSIHGDKAKAKWFLELGQRINDDLNKIGFSLCPGDIMAGNPLWNRSLTEWTGLFSGWITNSTPEAILDSNIFFDLRPVYGDFSLCSELKSSIRELAMKTGQFHYHLAASVTHFKVPSGSSLASDDRGGNGGLDLKRVTTPIVSYARLLSIISGGEETNSAARLREQLKAGVIGEESFDEVIFAYDHLMRLRLRNQAVALTAGRAPSNVIEPATLNSIERGTLKKVLTLVSNMQSSVATRFRLT